MNNLLYLNDNFWYNDKYMEKNNTLSILVSTFIFSIINELLFRVFTMFIFHYSLTQPVFLYDYGYYYYSDTLNIYLVVLLQLVLVFGFFNILLKLKFIEQNFYKLFTAALFISILSYFTSTPKNLNTFHFLTKYSFSDYNFTVVVLHTIILFIATFIFTKSYLSKKK